jgi:hypothetical protein
LILTKGYVYDEQATSFLGFKKSIGAGMGITNLSQSAHVFASKYRVLSSAVKLYKEVSKEDPKKAEAEKGVPNITEQGLESVLETLWNFTVVDVESTLRGVCTKVLKDSSIPFDDRVKRAEGMLIIGEIFQSLAQSAETGLSELESHLKQSVPISPSQTS